MLRAVLLYSKLFVMTRYLLTVAIAYLMFLCSCSSLTQEKYYKLQGFAQGSTYSIIYSWNGSDFAVDSAVDNLLQRFNTSLSNYDSTSIISRVNANDTTVVLDDWFRRFYVISQEVYDVSDGAFDITIAPLVNFWGFGYKTNDQLDTAQLDSLRKLVGMSRVDYSDHRVKMPDGTKLISNAIAQGLSVDIVAEFFDSLNVENYLVEIGGELRAKGVGNKGTAWKVGIDKPIDTLAKRELQVAVSLDNQALATSGNYRKFYERDGIKYSHTVDPVTGYPVRHSLLSATVIAENCALADAYATACMVKGGEWAKDLAHGDPTVEVLLISSTEDGSLEVFASDDFPHFEEY